VKPSAEDLYTQATELYGSALDRLAGAYERDPDKRRDLLQEIHLALWRSFEKFEARCSLRTWVYRVAHNTAASYVLRQTRANSRLLTLEDIEIMPEAARRPREPDERLALQRLHDLIHQLKQPYRELMLLYLEGLDSVEIGEIMGISSGNVRVQVHRIRTILARRFHAGAKV